jgi:hypothetical protein
VERINDRIRALEAVLTPTDDLDSPGPYETVETQNGAVPRIAGSPLAGKGLRESIKIVLSNYPTGLVPADIATRLQEMGFTASGNLSTAKRVYGELYRMRLKGLVSQRGPRYVVNA